MTPVRHLPDQAFPFLTLAERDRLLEYGHEEHFEPGRTILPEGHLSTAIYVLVTGRVGVETNHLGDRLVVDELRPGAVFGEASFLDGSPTSASVVAREAVDVFVLSELDALLASDVALACGFYRSLSTLLARRLRFATHDSVQATTTTL